MRVGIALILLVLAALLPRVPWVERLDHALLDAQFRTLRAHAPQPVAHDVVVVGFDEDTSRALREPITLWHPYLGQFLEAVAGSGATAVGLDIVLPDRSFDSIVPGYDRKLLAGLLAARRAMPVVLALTVGFDGKTRPIYPAFVAVAGENSTGYAQLMIDSDGVVRRFTEQLGESGSAVPTLAGQLARKLGKTPGDGLIDFAAGSAFDFIPLQTVLRWQAAHDNAQLAQAFGGKAVLLGGTFRFEDHHFAPVNLAAWDPDAVNVPGVLLHAQALRSLLNDRLIQPVAPAIPLALALAAALAWLWAPRVAVAVVSLAAIWIACIAGSTYALARGFELPVAGIMLTAFLAIGGRQGFEAALNLRERRRLRKAFGGYVSPGVMQEILAGTLNPTLGGVKQFACVLFSDIRGYTTRSEGLTPEQTIAFLNSYFDRIVPIIHEHGGTVVSFMGDGIMAAFGVPQPLPNPCEAAFETARSMLDHLRKWNAELTARGDKPLDIGIGLHAGEGVAGHIGAQTRHEYSVIGDVTNVASRLEGVTKEVGYHVVCSHAVADRLADRSALVPLGARPIKGHSPVEIFGYDRVSGP